MKRFFGWIKKHNLALQILFWLILGCGYWCYWHFKPFTPNAFIFACTRPVSPFTEGFITDIYVKNNQFVKKGDKLFSIFKPPYQLKLQELENEIAARRSELKSMEARIKRIVSEQKQTAANRKKTCLLMYINCLKKESKIMPLLQKTNRKTKCLSMFC